MIEEFELWPKIDVIRELRAGEVVEMPPPKQRHSALAKRIVRILSRRIDESRIWLKRAFSSTGIARNRHCHHSC
jgi:Uma2 family endonuclease